jgi:hypothetical protein
LIDLERNLKFLGKLKYLVSSGFGRFSLHQRRASAMEIGPTSTKAASGRGKTRTVANSRASGGGDEEEEFEVEDGLH